MCDKKYNVVPFILSAGMQSFSELQNGSNWEGHGIF